MRAIVSVVLVGCSAMETPGTTPVDPIEEQFSPLGKEVIAALHAHDHSRGLTWDIGSDDELGSGWVMQTPPAATWGQAVATLVIPTSCTGSAACEPDFGLIQCNAQPDCVFGGTCTPVAATVRRPGEPMRSLCVGHSDAMYDRIYKMIVGAQQRVEITSLGAPDGRFTAALRNAMTFLSHSGRSVRVRYLYGAVYGDSYSTDDVLASLVRDVDPASGLRVGVAALRDGPEDWNHTKMIAIDGAVALVGGHNMWTQHYLETAPVHDLSMQVNGSAAAHASRFADALWRRVCGPLTTIGSEGDISDFPSGAKVCSEPYDLPVAQGTGSTRVITIGRLATFGDNASDDAILALVGAAQTTLRLSLQDIGPVGVGNPWPEEYLQALVAALGRGVDIELVMTNLNSLPGGLTGASASYSNGWTPQDVVAKLRDYAAAHPDLVPANTTTSSMLCSRFHVTTLRPSADDRWPDGASFANHAKLVIVDDAAFYIGSQNWYPSNLPELGYIVDDPAMTQQLMDAYYNQAWQQSKRVELGC